ncbi:uncharacterized protein BJ171DRAFT_506610 [Polychytrium aggregatum]|uniref:uncharacterized protein n=1 Tax=Polychytrium aggregatum TaxID=110093 RepID=UPI0022FEA27D|nr:uncharacterized protein BJ171DRAFT_506610 [Polychytrium aggregatum]KAI9204225.1 hypothetical protein BJ171DRAFT_506610 [Polychytrium aggregatum]
MLLTTLSKTLAVLATGAAGLALSVYLMPSAWKRNLLVRVLKLGPLPDRKLPWSRKIFPHGELEQLADNLWGLSGSLPPDGPRLPRRMIIYRLPKTDRLWIHSPICCTDKVLGQITALGKVTFIVVPNPMHRLDAFVYAERFPEARVICPREFKVAAEQAVRVDAFVEDLFPPAVSGGSSEPNGLSESDPPIRYVAPKGFYQDISELGYLLRLENEQHHALVYCDTFFNIDPEEEPCLVWIGTACGFGCTAIGRFIAVESGPQARDWVAKDLVSIVQQYRVRSISMAHGKELKGSVEDVVRALIDAAETFVKAREVKKQV